MICEREGIGDLLAEGQSACVAKWGPRRRSSPSQVKGQPFPMHECRTRHGQALGYAVSPTGADHMHNFWDTATAKEPIGEDLQNAGVYEAVPQTELNAQQGARLHRHGQLAVGVQPHRRVHVHPLVARADGGDRQRDHRLEDQHP